ncbi:hypothetical protein [Cytophaga hutchinsonii]|uniref:hypothetical protein n=1 Tax=Cytophaga hutchinsonii TaxID=985 RepID=UPI0002E9A689|nr:hypothetical protein [Cytophaga hutchinsonii]
MNLEYLLKNELNHTNTYVKNHIWKYDYLITKILYQTILIPNKRYFTFSQTHVNEVMGRVKIKGKSDDSLYVVRNDLKKLGIINFNVTGTSDINKGKYTRTVYYKINDKYLNQGWHEVKHSIEPVEIKLKERQEYTGVYGKLRDILFNVSIDYQGAIKELKSLDLDDKKKSFNLTRINNIRDGIINFSVDFKSTLRVFHSISNLKRELRKYILINGKPLLEVDVSNAQPLLFCKMIREYTNAYLPESSTDIDYYIQLCETGRLYDYLSEQFGVKKTPEFKKEFFAKVFFSTENRLYKFRKIFDSLFPTVSKIISFYKEKNYKDLSIELQRLESEVMISNVAKNLIDLEVNEFITIHDAIYCTNEFYNVVRAEVISSFHNFGLNANIK